MNNKYYQKKVKLTIARIINVKDSGKHTFQPNIIKASNLSLGKLARIKTNI
jgi:hypothetical protein